MDLAFVTAICSVTWFNIYIYSLMQYCILSSFKSMPPVLDRSPSSPFELCSCLKIKLGYTLCELQDIKGLRLEKTCKNFFQPNNMFYLNNALSKLWI